MAATVRGISVEGRGGTFNDDSSKEYTVVYKVSTDDRNDGPNIVQQAFGIPNIGSLYTAGNDADVDAVVVNKTVSQGDSPWEWEVEVTFSTELEEEPPQQFEDPLSEPPVISYGHATRQIIVPGYYNTASNPNSGQDWESDVVAPNGEPFDPPIVADIAEPIFTVKRNVASISAAALMAVANAVNVTNYQGALPRTLKLDMPTAESKWHKSVGTYFETSFVMRYRWETWDLQRANRGTYYWSGGKPANAAGVTPKTIIDNVGNPIIVDLTTDGDLNTTGTPTFTRIRFYREIDFNSLGIL